MPKFREQLRKKGIWITPAQGEQLLSLLHKLGNGIPMSPDDHLLLDKFGKRVKETRS